MTIPAGMLGAAPKTRGQAGRSDEVLDDETPPLELYQIEGCSYCADVRQALDDLGLDYVVRTEPPDHAGRERVRALSGQTLVPVLVDRGRGLVVADSRAIIAYLQENFPRVRKR